VPCARRGARRGAARAVRRRRALLRRVTAAALASLGIPAFGCTSDGFPDLLAPAIGGGIATWAHRNGPAGGR